MHRRIINLPGKMKGRFRAVDLPAISLKYALWALISSFFTIYAMFLIADRSGYPILVAPFGASAVLLFGAADSALTQPRNLVGGHVISALIAIGINSLGLSGPFATALAVGGAVFLMYLTRTMHPPGGATAFLGVQGHVGMSFLFIPVLSGVAILLATALFMNNVVHHRQYPRHWL